MIWRCSSLPPSQGGERQRKRRRIALYWGDARLSRRRTPRRDFRECCGDIVGDMAREICRDIFREICRDIFREIIGDLAGDIVRSFVTLLPLRVSPKNALPIRSSAPVSAANDELPRHPAARNFLIMYFLKIN